MDGQTGGRTNHERAGSPMGELTSHEVNISVDTGHTSSDLKRCLENKRIASISASDPLC